MTAREIYEGVLIELNKVNAPSMLLEDFNYFFNKSIYQYVNKKYNTIGMNQENTDSTLVLIGHTFLEPFSEPSDCQVGKRNAQYTSAYSFYLPPDYFHLLGCTCVFNVKKNYKCYNEGQPEEFLAIRLTPDAWPIIMNNFYMKPSYKRPYYYIYNKNTGKALPTDTIEYDDSIETGIPTLGSDIIADEHTHSASTEYSRVIKLNNGLSVSVLKSEKPSGIRGGNPTNIILEIRCGKDNTVFQLAGVNIDYLKTPQHIRLTQEQLDYTEDKSQIVEFPDYVCQEIINELVHIVMENASDPRLQTHIPVSLSIASPAQELTQTTRKR